MHLPKKAQEEERRKTAGYCRASPIVEANTAEEFDRLNDPEKAIVQVTFVRLYLHNRGLPCGPRAIQGKLRDEGISAVPSTSTIARALRRQHLTHGRTGYYEEDHPSETNGMEGGMTKDRHERNQEFQLPLPGKQGVPLIR